MNRLPDELIWQVIWFSAVDDWPAPRAVCRAWRAAAGGATLEQVRAAEEGSYGLGRQAAAEEGSYGLGLQAAAEEGSYGLGRQAAADLLAVAIRCGPKGPHGHALLRLTRLVGGARPRRSPLLGRALPFATALLCMAAETNEPQTIIFFSSDGGKPVALICAINHAAAKGCCKTLQFIIRDLIWTHDFIITEKIHEILAAAAKIAETNFQILVVRICYSFSADVNFRHLLLRSVLAKRPIACRESLDAMHGLYLLTVDDISTAVELALATNQADLADWLLKHISAVVVSRSFGGG